MQAALLRFPGLMRCFPRPRPLATSSSGPPRPPSPSQGPPPRPPSKPRPDNVPLYEALRRERRALTERVALEKHRSELRRRQFDPQVAGSVEEGGVRHLTAARQRAPKLPDNCLPWRDYALFADPPALRPLKSLEEDAEGGSFASMLRRSSFVGLGDFEGRVVRGRIFERYEDNLYVDFGGKFHAVCPAPRVNSEKYVRGAQVTLRLIDPEMTSRFLGSERHITLAEADAVLLGLRAGGGGESPVEAAAEAAAEAEADPDTVSPLRLSLMQPALDEATVAAAAAAEGGGEGAVGDDIGEYPGDSPLV